MSNSPFDNEPVLVATEKFISPMESNFDNTPASLQTGSPFTAPDVVTTSASLQAYNGSIISQEVLDDLDKEALSRVGKTTERIIKSLNLQSFNELGDILARLDVTQKSLDVTTIMRDLKPSPLKRALTFFRESIIDIKTELTKRLNSADTVFETITNEIGQHIQRHNIWISDSDAIFEENKLNYTYLKNVLARVESLKEAQINFINGLPKIQPDDPDAIYKAQFVADQNSLLNLLDIKIDNIRRRIAVTETNMPRIRNNQMTNRNVIHAMNEILTNIPDLKLQFVLYRQSIEALDSVEFNNGVKNLLNQALTQGANASEASAIKVSTSLNAPIIANETLNTLRSSILNTVTSMQKIEQTAAQQREADRKAIDQSQTQLIEALQNKMITN